MSALTEILPIAHVLESTFWEEIPWDELPRSKAGRTAKKPAKKKAKAPTDDEAYALGDDDAGDGTGDDSTSTGKWMFTEWISIPTSDLHQLKSNHISRNAKIP